MLVVGKIRENIRLSKTKAETTRMMIISPFFGGLEEGAGEQYIKTAGDRGGLVGRRQGRDSRDQRRYRGGGKEAWNPITKRFVRDGKITVPTIVNENIDMFIKLKAEMLKVMSGARKENMFMTYVEIGDNRGLVEIGVECSKDVATAIRGSVILDKLSVIPVSGVFWGYEITKHHTVPSGKFF